MLAASAQRFAQEPMPKTTSPPPSQPVAVRPRQAEGQPRRRNLRLLPHAAQRRAEPGTLEPASPGSPTSSTRARRCRRPSTSRPEARAFACPATTASSRSPPRSSSPRGRPVKERGTADRPDRARRELAHEPPGIVHLRQRARCQAGRARRSEAFPPRFALTRPVSCNARAATIRMRTRCPTSCAGTTPRGSCARRATG